MPSNATVSFGNRSTWVLVLLIAGATGMQWAAASAEPSAAELLRQSHDEFSSNFIRFPIEAERANPPLPVSDYWRAFDHLNALRTNGTEPVRTGLQVGYAAQLISRAGTLVDFDRLLAFADQLPAECLERRHVMNALLDFAIRLEVDALARQGPLKVHVPVDNPWFESKVEGVSAEVAAANRLFNAVCSLRPTPPVDDGKVSVQANWGFFYDTISALLCGKLQDASHVIQQFRWGGWCGTGMRMLIAPQSRALFLACIQERKFDAALGAVCAIRGSDLMTLPSLADDGAARRKFITLCGLDWETLYAGALAEPRPNVNGDWIGSLARFGTERSARLLAGMAGMPRSAHGESAFLRVVGAFAGESQSVMDTNADGTIRFHGFWRHKEYARAGPNPAPPELQLTLLEILHARLRATNVSRTVAEVVVSILAELRRPESKSVLEEAMQLPYEHVRQTAAHALERMGERGQRPPPMAPAVFQISALRPGEYELEIRLSGAAFASIPFVVDAEKAAPVTMFLDPGADVRSELIAPGGASAVRRPTFEIIRADQRMETFRYYRYVDWRTNLLRGLPVGEYSLLVPSRADQLRRNFGVDEIIPAGSAYQGANVRFTIKADSPRLIDLGSVNLKPE